MPNLSAMPVLNALRGKRVIYLRLFLLLITTALLAACEGKPAAMSVANDSHYDPRQVFNSEFMQNTLTPQRSASGIPGPTYWQNRADYTISAKLDQLNHILIARDVITYTNNSPDSLSYLWLQLEQNIYRADSRGMLTAPYGDPRSQRVTSGIQLKDVYIAKVGNLEKVRYFINDTNMRIDLPESLPAHGGKLRIIIDYSFEISNVFYGEWTRMGRMSTPDGPIYAIAQWYPRMDVYDDVTGWNTLPYRHQGEFYLDYGDYQYNIDVPCGYIVVGSGSLMNPNAVLTNEEISRLREASKSDATIHIVSPFDVGKSRATSKCHGRRVWKFQINNARDAVWAASPAYVWDAAKINLPDGKHALAMAVYPRASAVTPDGWGNAVQFLKKDIEFFSTRFYTYPYPTAVAMAAPASGMEYPAGFFLSYVTKGNRLFNAITHEIGHTWFPITVGSNERLYAWMDEGFDIFINHVAWDTYADHSEGAGLRAGYAQYVTNFMNHETLPIMTPADDIPNDQLRSLEYEKPALGLGLLRNYILAPENFDHAFNAYIQAWAYRHPTPYDFFRFMNNETGENLDWFWKEWFFENWKLDQAVTDVRYVDNDPKKGGIITIMNNDRMVMPVVVAVHESGGKTTIIKLPVEIWAEGNIWKFKANTSSKIRSVVIDPDNLLPDADRTNNTWNAPP